LAKAVFLDSECALMSKLDPWGKEWLWGRMPALRGWAVWHYARCTSHPCSLLVPAAAGKEAGGTLSPATVQHRTPSLCCSCSANQCFQCTVTVAWWAHHV